MMDSLDSRVLNKVLKDTARSLQPVEGPVPDSIVPSMRWLRFQPESSKSCIYPKVNALLSSPILCPGSQFLQFCVANMEMAWWWSVCFIAEGRSCRKLWTGSPRGRFLQFPRYHVDQDWLGPEGHGGGATTIYAATLTRGNLWRRSRMRWLMGLCTNLYKYIKKH